MLVFKSYDLGNDCFCSFCFAFKNIFTGFIHHHVGYSVVTTQSLCEIIALFIKLSMELGVVVRKSFPSYSYNTAYVSHSLKKNFPRM